MAAIATLTTYDYQAPSCLLRVTGQLSALSQLTRQPVLRGLRFDLQIGPGENPEAMPDSSPLLTLKGEENQLLELSDRVQNYVQGHLQGQVTALPQGGWITLTRLGLTRHALQINQPRPRVVILSTLQLADLADVLDQMDSQLQVRAEERSPAVRQRPARVRLWIGSVAAVLVAAVLGHQWLLPNPPAVVRSPLPETPEAAPPTPWSKLPAPSPATTSAPRPPLPRSSPAAPVDRQLPQTAREPVAKTVDPRTGALRPTPTLAPVTPVTPDSPVARLEPDSPGTHQPQQSPLALSTAPPQSGPTAALQVLSQALQAGWAVPPQLGESLSYQITLAADGTVITVQPLSSLARDYQTQVGLPQVNQRIPGLGLTQRITVEVNYLLDGSVRVVPQPLAP